MNRVSYILRNSVLHYSQSRKLECTELMKLKHPYTMSLEIKNKYKTKIIHWILYLVQVNV